MGDIDALAQFALGIVVHYLGDPLIDSIVSVTVIGFIALFRNSLVDHRSWNLRHAFVGSDFTIALLGVGLGTFFYLIFRYLFTPLNANSTILIASAVVVLLVVFMLTFVLTITTERLANEPLQKLRIILIINLTAGALPLVGVICLFTRYLGHVP